MKANKDGWIRHRGGKCPVEKGVHVDVRHRDGEEVINVPAQVYLIGARCASDWDHSGHIGDIMAYRIHKPEQQSGNTTVIPELAHKEETPIYSEEFKTAVAAAITDPIYCRDRIKDIDLTIQSLEEERASLIQLLADGGFQLIRVVAKPTQDMDDIANWEIGDLIQALDGVTGQFTEGHLYFIRDVVPTHNHVKVVRDDSDSATNGWLASKFKWHSRPSA